MQDKSIILFDGVCNFCDSAVNFTIQRDKQQRYQFAPLQSEHGLALAKQYGVDGGMLSSFLLIEKGQIYSRSTAALKVCRHLSGGWPLLYTFLVVPAFIRNAVYDWIARNRYKWFGKKDQCMIPSPEVRARFLQ